MDLENGAALLAVVDFTEILPKPARNLTMSDPALRI